ncbi:hypothetical protein [Burkholderia anthina]|uniref:hypothetical protein n=1 Tax=Burkholderia anthina TaxID=179879 RepID=UPI00158A126F|nr:hypothetical protein [Burkholderia anthina]
MTILDNAQDALNAANKNLSREQQLSIELARGQVRRLAAEGEAAQSDARRARERAIYAEQRADDAEKKLAELLAENQKLGESLDEWIISQKAFRSLLFKFGRMPDGTAFSALPQPERLRIIEEEERNLSAGE